MFRREGMPYHLSVSLMRKQLVSSKKNLIPLANALPGLANIVVDQDTADRIRKGYQPDCRVLYDKKTPLMEKGDLVKFMMQDGSIIAVAKTLFSAEEGSQLNEGRQAAKILRVFN